jgi:hypothetical protein
MGILIFYYILFYLYISVFAVRPQTMVFTVCGRGRGSEHSNTENSCLRSWGPAALHFRVRKLDKPCARSPGAVSKCRGPLPALMRMSEEGGAIALLRVEVLRFGSWRRERSPASESASSLIVSPSYKLSRFHS